MAGHPFFKKKLPVWLPINFSKNFFLKKAARFFSRASCPCASPGVVARLRARGSSLFRHPPLKAELGPVL